MFEAGEMRTCQSCYSDALAVGALDIMVYYDLENNVIDSFIDEDGNPYEQLPGYSIEQTEQIYLDLFSNLCNTGHIGLYDTSRFRIPYTCLPSRGHVSSNIDERPNLLGTPPVYGQVI
jgi:hypothetical protein